MHLKQPNDLKYKIVTNEFEIIPEVAASYARVLKPMNAATMGIVDSLQCNALLTKS